MADQEKELIKKRASFKGRLTAFKNYIDTLDSKTLNDQDVTELQLRVSRMESVYDQYDEVQLMLECLLDSKDGQHSDRSEFESNYYKSVARAQNIISEFNRTDKSFNSEKSTHVNNHKLVKLPTINLPKFSGSYHNYLEFRDSFVSLIHSNDEIDDINKFHYLRACLEGAAAVVIQSVEFSASNYAVAWKLLCDRYDNKRLLIQNHVSALFQIDAVTRESSVSLKHLIDVVNKNLRALESLGEPVKYWDTLLIYIITHKLDQKTYRAWEEFKGRLDTNSSITFEFFMQFMRNHADLIETLETSRNKEVSTAVKPSSKVRTMISVRSSSTGSPPKNCLKCNGDHKLINCPQFLALSNDARLKLLPTYKVCFNCLQTGHFANNCKKPGCKMCKRRHNTLIHVAMRKSTGSFIGDNNFAPESSSSSPLNSQDSNNVALSANVTSHNIKQSDVLLSTALIKLYDNNDREHVVRAVLDCGSTSCLITQRLCDRLNLVTRQIDRSILGINNVISHVGKTCRVNIKSLDDSFCTELHCLVLPLITNNVPGREINLSDLKIPSDICLADPTFYKPGDVDILIGADLFWDLLGSQKIKQDNSSPVLCETRLGWIISGPIISDCVTLLSNNIQCNFVKLGYDASNDNDDKDDIRSDLQRFWQLEEINPILSHYSPEEKACEEHFTQNVSRLQDGRFCVRIPLKQSSDILGDSFKRASQCLLSLERRLKAKPDLSKMYYDFMLEYQALGHMSELEVGDQDHKAYYIPHHGVLRENSTTTKLRVVYNASSPSTSGISCNDIQMVGPTIQDDLLSILLRFRQHKYILSADVEKMYRQIVVHPSDRYLQEILWRSNVDEPVKIFQLNTVTYGTASAPYLATRCLKQIGLECKNSKIGEIIIHDFYVDDLLTGCDDLNELKFIRCEVTDALASACMPLRKWKSNVSQLVSKTSEMSLNLNIGSQEPSKLLGLGWHADSDELCFPISNIIPNGNTKRNLLSVIAQIFDPLGLLAPCVIKMKIILQKLWLDKLSWDEPLPAEINKRWRDVVETLPILNTLRVERIVVCDSYITLDLHIFSDASESAYGACVYVRSVNKKGEVMVRLLMAKSRVAPIKPTTIPRLELCGVLVAVRLYEKVINSLRVKINKSYFWTDSTIVLGWLQMMPSRLQPFVRNRVAEVLEKAGNCTWRHVPTHLNSADLISRGMDIRALQNLDLWWSGPEFLKYDSSQWPCNLTCREPLPETRVDTSLNVVETKQQYENFIDIDRFSNYLRLIRSVAYLLRFIKVLKGQPVKTTFISSEELNNAMNLIISKCQYECFPEYKMLLNKISIPKKSTLLKFNVFLDENNVMRVGGRLDNSDFSYDKKHPIILQSTHKFTKLLFDYEHKKLMHAGPQLLLASIRESYWPIGGRNLAKATYHNCVKCRRVAGKITTPLMGNLPQQRVTPGYAFECVGVDYAGPITCVSRQGRGSRAIKVYIAVFVCFTTKAIHLELVSDLTSNNYLQALRRFMSRRGKPRDIYSDNGTSFIGAYNDLSKFLKNHCDSLSETLANEHINFHFIPAYSPNFGGLWEAGVKSTKFHLRRVLGNCMLTYEELYTTLTQIEAILNSRPLSPLSSDPADYTPLTPGHFLIGRALTSLPQPNYKDTPTSHLTRYQRIEQLRQQFWSRWSKEYIAELQQRVKWRSCKDNLKLDSLVVVKDDDLPPLKWKLGRIIAVHPGADGIVRVADIKTSMGTIRRSFNRICPLPVTCTSG